jgi:hypothetical protein
MFLWPGAGLCRGCRSARASCSSPARPISPRAARRQAFDAARAAGAGRTRQQIREIYQAELRSRGLPLPSDLLLDAYSDMIARNRQKMSLRFAARVLAEMGKDFNKAREASWHPDSR